jgi:hypothetical protein
MNRSGNTIEGDPYGSTFFHRRQFLALGSAGLLAPIFKNLAWAEPLAVAGDAVVRPLSVAYIEGSETFRDLRRLPRKIRRPGLVEESAAEAPPVLVPAISLFQGDTSLPGRPLRIRIDGLYPPFALEPKRWRELPLAADLDVLFPSPDPAFPAPLRFQAWSFRRRPGWNPSPPISFRFPLDWQALPQFVLRVRYGPEVPPIVMRTKFTVDNEAGRPRLRRGVYLLGFMPSAWDREVKLAEFARRAPAELFSILVSMNPEEEE